jgi:hypothetical protein
MSKKIRNKLHKQKYKDNLLRPGNKIWIHIENINKYVTIECYWRHHKDESSLEDAIYVKTKELDSGWKFYCFSKGPGKSHLSKANFAEKVNQNVKTNSTTR